MKCMNLEEFEKQYSTVEERYEALRNMDNDQIDVFIAQTYSIQHKIALSKHKKRHITNIVDYRFCYDNGFNEPTSVNINFEEADDVHYSFSYDVWKRFLIEKVGLKQENLNDNRYVDYWLSQYFLGLKCGFADFVMDLKGIGIKPAVFDYWSGPDDYWEEKE